MKNGKRFGQTHVLAAGTLAGWGTVNIWVAAAIALLVLGCRARRANESVALDERYARSGSSIRLIHLL